MRSFQLSKTEGSAVAKSQENQGRDTRHYPTDPLEHDNDSASFGSEPGVFESAISVQFRRLVELGYNGLGVLRAWRWCEFEHWPRPSCSRLVLCH